MARRAKSSRDDSSFPSLRALLAFVIVFASSDTNTGARMFMLSPRSHIGVEERS